VVDAHVVDLAQNCVQRNQVRMDIRDDGCPHGPLIEGSII
jgi:hypothetical protein